MRGEDLVRAVSEGKVAISDHADEEARNDGLSFDEIYFSVYRGGIIKEYPSDRPYPSCLVYGDTFGVTRCIASGATTSERASRS